MTYEDEELNKKFLDTLDLSKYINESNDVLSIIEAIKRDYDDNKCLPIELQGCVFNNLCTEDIAHYLGDRYGKYVHEEVIHKYTLY